MWSLRKARVTPEKAPLRNEGGKRNVTADRWRWACRPGRLVQDTGGGLGRREHSLQSHRYKP